MTNQLPMLSLLAPLTGGPTQAIANANNPGNGEFILYANDTSESKKRKRVEKKKKEKDPNAPKRPLSAFFLYQHDVRKDVKALHPEMNGPEVAKEMGRTWADLDPLIKKTYMDAAEIARGEYEKVKANYDADVMLAEAAGDVSVDAVRASKYFRLPGRSISAPSGGMASTSKGGYNVPKKAGKEVAVNGTEENSEEEDDEESEVDELEEVRPMKMAKREIVMPPMPRNKGKENKAV
ncbi:hypothetical protein M408DRAFT_333748 [Serendipita vermifera MAFF 305830]|uniref:HMG box domain-containing protein n=1 Tax=Serendipita vermifera MAFF 305830 TaxID=933852 RepID=A0A0C3A8G9_SERVB|nr:hypothetical protein M408DRAFT_333748 [Serendipita vermifera MAFF 305830]